MNLYLAIDAGQTHTECVAVNEAGVFAAQGEGGPSYAQDGTPMVRASFDDALARMDIAADSVRVVLVGATGGQIPGRLAALDADMRARFPAAHVVVVPDGEFVLRSYVGDGAGGVLIAGTGSVAVGRFGGRLASAGGYGYLFGDEGAGSWLVFRYVRRALHLADEGAPLGDLATAVCQHFGVDDVRAIPGAIYRRGAVDVHAIAGAAVLVARAAQHGDALAAELMHHTGVELALLVTRLRRALDVPAGATFPLFLLGGMWRAHALLLPPFEAALPPDIRWTTSVVEGSPTLAAARYARQSRW